MTLFSDRKFSTELNLFNSKLNALRIYDALVNSVKNNIIPKYKPIVPLSKHFTIMYTPRHIDSATNTSGRLANILIIL